MSAPEIIHPLNSVEVSSTNLIVEWKPVAGAVKYSIYLQKIDCEGSNWIFNETSGTKRDISIAVKPGCHYKLGLKARNDYAYGNESVTEFYTSSGQDVSILSVSPATQIVTYDAGVTTFSVFNTGTGTMSWTSSVVSGGDWLSITSGSSGSNTGTISCGYTANTGTTSRTATIRVTASGATGSPADVKITQAANTTKCTATIDGNLSLHVPLLSHLIPYWGAPSYTVDMVYQYNSAYPTLIPFKLTQAEFAQSGVYLCDAATLSDDFTIHIPDVLLPDGITRMWLDLSYSAALSTNGSVCFYVSNYGEITK